MSTTINFDEFDDATREYLLEVREREGRGTPGVFAPVNASLAGCGCIMGPIIIITTLCITMLSGVIYKTPTRIAMLQTAGFLLGGWMLVAAFRVWGSKNSQKRAGTWVFGDPLYLYEAAGEQVKVTAVDEVIEAQYTHNYNNGAYQNSVVKLLMPGNSIVATTVNNEQRAEQMVVYYNYLAWARGADGGDRANLAPAVLGGLAKYVAKNDNEPLDGEGNVNLDLVELDVTEMPEEPRREGGGTPNFLPYIVMVVAGFVCFFLMKQINTPMRDDEIHKAVMREPVEPHWLRLYLMDTRNKKHREAVSRRLASFYDTPIAFATSNATSPALGRATAKVLEELRAAELPVASIRVKELGGLPGLGSGDERAKKVQTKIADTMVDQFVKLYPRLTPPGGATFVVQPPPVGRQLVEFVEAPEEAAAHIEVDYKFEDGNAPGLVKVQYAIRIRSRIEDGSVESKDNLYLVDALPMSNLDAAVTKLGEQVVRDIFGMVAEAKVLPPGVPPGGHTP